MFNFLRRKKIPVRDPKDFDDLMIKLQVIIDVLESPFISIIYVERSVKILKEIEATLSEFGPKKSRTYEKWISTYLRNVKAHPIK